MIKNLNEAKSKEDVYEYLQKWLQDQLELSRREQLSLDKFESPAWSEYMACQIGGQRIITKLQALIPDREKK